MAKSNYLNYIHNFRGIAIIFVVAGHILYGWEDKEETGYKIINSVFQNGTVLFIFIAGYLFQHLSARFEFKSYFRKKIENVILPYLIVSFPIIVVRIFTVPDYILEIRPDFAEWSVAGKALYLLGTGAHLLPLWFVPMIFMFYLIAPLLIYGDRSSFFYKLLPLFVVVSLLVPRAELENIPRMFIHFFSVYVFGMFCSHYKNEVLEFSKKYWMPFTLLTVLFMIVSLFDMMFYDQIMYLQKMLLCWFFIYWLWRLDHIVPKPVPFLADISFGIFFLHFYFVIALRYLQMNVLKIPIHNIFIYWTLHFVLAMILTSVAIVVIRKLSGKKSKMLIGC